MQTYRLRDLIETEFFYETFKKDVENLISKCLDAKNKGTIPETMPNDLQMEVVKEVARTHELPIIDVSGVKVTDSAASYIALKQRVDNIQFIDTANPGRDRVLRYNYETSYRPPLPTDNMPTWDGKQKLEDYYRSFNHNECYTFPNTKDTYYFALAALYMSFSSKQNFCVSNTTGRAFLRYLHSHLFMKHFRNVEEFYGIEVRITDKDAVVDVVKLRSDGKIETREGLTMNYDKAWSALSLVPVCITDPVYIDNHPEAFNNLIEKSFDIVKKYSYSQPRDLYTLLIQANEFNK